MIYRPPCKDWAEKLAMRHEDLSPSEHMALNEHIMICSACKMAQADYQLLIARVQARRPAMKTIPQFSFDPFNNREVLREDDNEDVLFAGSEHVRTISSRTFSHQRKLKRSTSWVIRSVNVLAAVFVLGTIVAGFFLLLTHHHTTTVGTTTSKISISSSNPYSSIEGKLVLNDPLYNNSKGYRWSEYTATSNSCQFTDGAYVASSAPHVAGFCYATAASYSNFAFEMSMKILQGDCGAILFRANNASNSFNYFQICKNGLYTVGTYSNSIWSNSINFQLSSAVHQGLDQTNLVAVVAIGKNFDLYVNHHRISSVSGDIYSEGQIGTMVSAYYGDPSQILFSNAKVWKL